MEAEEKIWIAVYTKALMPNYAPQRDARHLATSAAGAAVEDLRAWQKSERERVEREAEAYREAQRRHMYDLTTYRTSGGFSDFGPSFEETGKRVVQVLAWLLDQGDLKFRVLDAVPHLGDDT